MTIKEIRINARLTQSEFAQEIGVKPLEVSRWERGVSKPSLKNIKKIETKFRTKL